MKANQVLGHFGFMIDRIFIKITFWEHIGIDTMGADWGMYQCVSCIINVNGAKFYVFLAPPH